MSLATQSTAPVTPVTSHPLNQYAPFLNLSPVSPLKISKYSPGPSPCLSPYSPGSPLTPQTPESQPVSPRSKIGNSPIKLNLSPPSPRSGSTVHKDKGSLHKTRSSSISSRLSISSSIGDLSSVTYIDLSASKSCVEQISTTGRLPRFLQKCTSLQCLVASDLALTVVDEWVSHTLTNLKILRLRNNRIATWPDHLARLFPHGKLVVLDLEGNPCFDDLCERSTSFSKEYFSENSDKKTNTIESQLYSHPHKQIIRKKSLYDDDSDDDMLTSLAPMDPLKSLDSPIEFQGALLGDTFSDGTYRSRRLSVMSSGGNNLSLSPVSPLQSSPDRFAHQKAESSEMARTRIIVKLLRDIRELSTNEIVKVPKPSNDSRQSSVGSSRYVRYQPSISTASSGIDSIYSRPSSVESTDSMTVKNQGLRPPALTPTEAAKIFKEFVKSEEQYVKYLAQLDDVS